MREPYLSVTNPCVGSRLVDARHGQAPDALGSQPRAERLPSLETRPCCLDPTGRSGFLEQVPVLSRAHSAITVGSKSGHPLETQSRVASPAAGRKCQHEAEPSQTCTCSLHVTNYPLEACSDR